MASELLSIRLTGAVVLRDGQLEQRSVALSGGRITKGPLPEVDMSGFVILPGIVDLHSLTLEQETARAIRQGAGFADAVHQAARKAAAAGITTCYEVQGWSWEGGLRGPSQAEAHIADFDILSKDQPVDQRIKLQCETHLVDHVDRLQALIQRHRLKYVVFSDRTSQTATDTAPDGGAWYLNPLEYAARAKAALANARAAPRFVCQMAEFLDDHAVIYGSLNDPDGETRETYSMMGAKLCEKPAQRSAAALARAVNDPVILEASAVAPSGADRMAPALAEALASYGSETPLFRAALSLGKRAGWDLAKAWALVSSRPAELMHMADRGSIAYGKRADLVLYNPQTDAVEGTICAGRVAHLTGEAEARFFCARKENQSAAE